MQSPTLPYVKKIFILFFCAICYSAAAKPPVKNDSLLNILQVKEKEPKEKLLAKYIRDNFLASSIGDVDAIKVNIDRSLVKYNVENKAAFNYFAESMYHRRLSHIEASEDAMIKAIRSADKHHDWFLSYTFLNYLAHIQTEEGNAIGAVSSYRMANKDAITLNDTNLQMIIDINISDVYYRYSFYGQSLFYLNQALIIAARFWPDDQRIKNIVYYSKCENFFKTNKADSLNVYNKRLKESKANTFKLYTYKNRTDYYLYLIHHDYKNAITLIRAMQHDGGYIFEEQDMQNLSDAFYHNGQPDSAKAVINRLLSSPSDSNHPEIKYHLYEILGKIAEQQKDYRSATDYFNLSLQQSKDNINRLTQIDDISSLMKADDVAGYYSQENEIYKEEQVWLIIVIIFALLIILVIAMFYRTVKQKQHYERLLFAAKKHELSFINSHDVRKYLTNILGLIEVIRESKNRNKAYSEVEDYLFTSARQLDKAIKNISDKLDGD